MKDSFQRVKENYDLACAFDLEMSDSLVEKAEGLFELEYDETLGGFWKRSMYQVFRSVFSKIEILIDDLESNISNFDFIVSFECLVDKVNQNSEFLELRKYVMGEMISKMEEEVGGLSEVVSDIVWAEMVESFGFEVNESVRSKRLLLKRYVEVIRIFNEHGVEGLDEMNVVFPGLKSKIDLNARLLNLKLKEAKLIICYRDLFNSMKVEVSEVEEGMFEVNSEVLSLIDAYDEGVGVEPEPEIEPEPDRLFWDQGGEVLDVQHVSDEVLWNIYLEEFLEASSNDFDKFINNPEFSRSLLHMFGSVKLTVETENENCEDRKKILSLYLHKLVSIGESKKWSEVAVETFKSCMVEVFIGYGDVLNDVILLLESLDFSELGPKSYYPAYIVFENNVQLKFKVFKKFIKAMEGRVNTNGNSSHPEYIIDFDNFTFTCSIPTGFYVGQHERYVRMTMNELNDFMDLNETAWLTENDYQRLKEAYEMINIRIDYRPKV